MKKNLFLAVIIGMMIIAFSSCKKEYENPEIQPVKAVLDINQGAKNAFIFKSVQSQGDTLIKNIVATISGVRSTGPIKSYSLTFGDGNGTGYVNVDGASKILGSHPWVNVGQYAVTLSVFSGENGTGATNSTTKTIWIVDSITHVVPPIENDILILLDSVWNPANQEWTCNFKVNANVAFYNGYVGPFYYIGDQSGWSPLTTPMTGTMLNGWFHFNVTAGQYGHRFNLVDNTGQWGKTTPDVNQNETSLSKWNVYGCFEVIGLPNKIVPAYTPGIRGDQQVSLEPYGVGYTRINIKDLNFRWVNKTPGIWFLKQSGWGTPIALTVDPSDPYGRWSYTVVKNSDFFWEGNPFSGTCFFQLLPDYTSTTFVHIWPQSYFYCGGYPNNTPPIPPCFSFQTTEFK